MIRYFTITLLLAGCVREANDIDRGKITAEVTAMMQDYANDIRQDGLSAELKYLDSSADFFWVPPGYGRAIGYDSVKRVLLDNAPKLASVDNRYESLSIVPLSHDRAAYTARLRSVVVTKAGDTSSSVLLETGVVLLLDGRWKLLCGQTSIAP